MKVVLGWLGTNLHADLLPVENDRMLTLVLTLALASAPALAL